MKRKHEGNTSLLYFNRTDKFLNNYLPKCRYASSGTSDTYKYGIAAFSEYAMNVHGISSDNLRFSDIDYDFMLDFRNYLKDTKHLAESTCNNYLSANVSYISYCASCDVSVLPTSIIAAKVPGYTMPLNPQPVISNEIGLATLLSSPDYTHQGIRDRAMLCLTYDGALRCGELTSICYGDVTWTDPVRISIVGKGRKQRTIFLDEKTSALLGQFRTVYHKDPDPCRPLFYTKVCGQINKMTTRNVERLFSNYGEKTRELLSQKYGDAAKDMFPEKFSTHTLRRTRATLLYRDGTPIEEISVFLGHANTEVTRSHYAFASDEQLLEMARKKTEAIPVVEHSESKDETLSEGKPEKKLWENKDTSTIFDLM